ncbi:hypothetical protein N7E70_022175 [Aminobacter sp. NyZ550]|uniref:hypothetical protein n=1 Tax=Aminobacter sp. NyZ550 TaxID=2979870 RepID=UPI0021D59DB7|nr:hypothetical protein [Aminobacter sp. NyZ550]WAX94352.1 hypothetical protein N7E70_022175 [Aminobacter sp. NyZ550]
MPYLDIYLAQLTDPFRIGLLVALLVTAANTAPTLNRWIPIALGVVFVAVLIPFSFGASDEIAKAFAVAVGLVSNVTLLAVLLGAKALYARFARG